MISSSDDPADLDLSPEVMCAMGQAVLDRVVDFIKSLPDQPACGNVHAEQLCRSLRETVPEHGTPIGELLGPLFEDWIPRSFNTAGPGYLAYIPGGGIFPAALADLIAGGTNRYTGIWTAAPALVQLEANVLDWIRDWMGFPSTTRGLFTTGGSMSIFNAILCARAEPGNGDPTGRSLCVKPCAFRGRQVGPPGRHFCRSCASDRGRFPISHAVG